MQIYPAMRARMGDWNYYMVRMTMREVAREVRLASDLWEDRTLSDAIQRVLDESRVKQQIVEYLSRRDDRFFGSLVVAAIGGNPTWTPEELTPSMHSRAFAGVFGTLSFDEDPKYFALDGQHRLKAIQELLEDPAGAPQGFDGEQISVLVVLREDQHVEEKVWLQRYRRLFSSLNRYARPTDRDTNIIMDEDDVFAILTRRLISEYEFFQASDRESFRVQTKGKNLKEGSPFFTSLQTLYAMNETLLMDAGRRRKIGGKELKVFKQFRPREDTIEEWYDEICRLWEALLLAVPVLREDPARMRVHALPEPNTDRLRDHLLFWPIGQELLANVARALLDREAVPRGAGVEQMAEVLSPLAGVPWDLHHPPWSYLLLVPKGVDLASWRMRSEDRKSALQIAERLVRWLVRLDDLNENEEGELRRDWESVLLYPPSKEMEDAFVEDLRSEAAGMWRRASDAMAAIAAGERRDENADGDVGAPGDKGDVVDFAAGGQAPDTPTTPAPAPGSSYWDR